MTRDDLYMFQGEKLRRADDAFPEPVFSPDGQSLFGIHDLVEETQVHAQTLLTRQSWLGRGHVGVVMVVLADGVITREGLRY